VCCEKQSAKLGFGGHFLVDAFAYGVVFLYELMQVQYPVAMSVSLYILTPESGVDTQCLSAYKKVKVSR